MRWEKARSRSRQGILEAAGHVFIDDGFEKATMKRIAEVCGVTKATVYAHFRDKVRLYNAVMDRYLASMPEATFDPGAEVELAGALTCIAQGIRTLASHPACQAFCRTLTRSELDKGTYLERWNAILQPYAQAAVCALANVSRSQINSEDGEKFLRLILAEEGLPQGTEPVSSSDATIALFLRSYGSEFARSSTASITAPILRQPTETPAA
ncbi:TetR/AcrR family transcriptional regulator [Stenotrophomonas sp. TWI587]|jgi:AcrR family transcriptional regulator